MKRAVEALVRQPDRLGPCQPTPPLRHTLHGICAPLLGFRLVDDLLEKGQLSLSVLNQLSALLSVLGRLGTAVFLCGQTRRPNVRFFRHVCVPSRRPGQVREKETAGEHFTVSGLGARSEQPTTADTTSPGTSNRMARYGRTPFSRLLLLKRSVL